MAEAPNQEEQEVVAEVRGKSKLPILIVAALLVLGGGGGAAWYFMQPKATGSEEKAAEKPAEKKAAAPVFMTLETFTVNLAPELGEQYLQTDISLQLTEAANEAQIKQMMPLVKAQILMILSSKKSSEISTTEGKNALSKEIVDTLNPLLPHVSNGKAISGVFFTSFIIQ